MVADMMRVLAEQKPEVPLPDFADAYETQRVLEAALISAGSGQGIVGMQERAILLGGTFEAGPRPEGGFRVLARLPIGDQ